MIEKGPIQKYIVYALGEIALVVIGILIALQINNWNEWRRTKHHEQQLFQKILEDLQNDSLYFAHALTRFKNLQDLNFHLYEETKGEASFDSTLQYGLIRYSYPFNPVVKGNYQPLVDNIIDETVRDSLSVYFRREENAREGVLTLVDLQRDFVRPYLTSHNLMDSNAVFASNRYENNDPGRMLDYDALKAQFNTPEFAQVLLELKLKTSTCLQAVSRMIKENKKLSRTIRHALAKE